MKKTKYLKMGNLTIDLRKPEEILDKYDLYYRVKQYQIQMNEDLTMDQAVTVETQFFDPNLLVSRKRAMAYVAKALKTKVVLGKFPGVVNQEGPGVWLNVHLMLTQNEFFDLVGFDEETTKEGREIERLLLDFLVPGKYFLGW